MTDERGQTIDRLMVELASSQGKHQACEEIIARTKAIVEELRAGGTIGDYAHKNLMTALGPTP